MDTAMGSVMSAVISPCGRFRFRLTRALADATPNALTYAFFGINPSTADAQVDDHTVRKWAGFTKTWGGQRFLVGNVCAYRATHVRELAQLVLTAEQRSENQEHLQCIVAEADVLVPCWGNRLKAPAHLQRDFDVVLDLLLNSGKPVRHLGLTLRGDPRHPMALSYATPLTPWGVA